ncbi:hypothetical protein HPB48_001528 [Haemaphysalis longicornis]|uniref:SHSP domain-containing protein n=1 Tax=Haemaphysalis longicornis TaxID=44386 RepID=A0A9J6GZ35_HAELO|nr:hypothetical protein HPB48_001528 [Haemaphysalis longicornis]
MNYVVGFRRTLCSCLTRAHVYLLIGGSHCATAEGVSIIGFVLITFPPFFAQVKTVDNQVVIHGKHGDRTDELGVISREFTRKCTLPKDVLPESVKCSITSDGFLIIEAPKRSDKPHGTERVVPITVVDGSSSTSNTATTSGGVGPQASTSGGPGKKTTATTSTTLTSGGGGATESRTSSSMHTVTSTSSKTSYLKNGVGPGISTGAISKVK